MMIPSEMLAFTYGLSSALIWGAADFSGGLASRRSHVFSVILISQIIGAAFLLLLAFYFKEPIPSAHDVLFGMMAGACGLVGLMAFYRGLAGGNMGVVAPVSAVVTALMPILLAFFWEGLPKSSQIAGFFLALVAVWLLAYSGRRAAVQNRDLALAVVAGLGFGFFFIFIDQASQGAVVWPLVSARFCSITLMSLILVAKGGVRRPDPKRLPMIAAAGILDTMGNALFVLAAQVGRLDISAALASLYPASTVLLAWLILKENLGRGQWAGVFLALGALVLIAY